MWIIQGSSHCGNTKAPESFTVTDFSPSALSAFDKSVTRALNNNQLVYPIDIDSYGGNIDTLIGFISVIEAAKSRGLKFATVVKSKAMSAGAILWTFGDANGDSILRFIGDHASLMFHSACVVIGGKVPETKENLIQNHNKQIALFEKASKNLKKSKNWLTSNLNKRKDYDWELSADDVEKEHIGLKYIPSFVFSVEEFFKIV